MNDDKGKPMNKPITNDGVEIKPGMMVCWRDGKYVRWGRVSNSIPPDENGINVDDGTDAEWLLAPGDVCAVPDAINGLVCPNCGQRNYECLSKGCSDEHKRPA